MTMPRPSATNVSPSPVLTTTVFPSGSALPTSASHHSTIPVASVVGGSAAGIALAFAAVIGWIWWGRCLERDKAKAKKKQLAFLEVRENTRRNASSSHVGSANYTSPSLSSLPYRHQNRSVKFISGPSSTPSTPPLPQIDLEKNLVTDASITSPIQEVPVFEHLPQKRSPLAPLTSQAVPSRPPLSKSGTYVNRSPPVHRSSLTSTPSIYSTPSGEESSLLAPPSLLAAALGTGESRRTLSAVYLAPGLAQVPSEGPSRLSQVSSGSTDAQPDMEPGVPIGYAQ